jgi:hypothetical protein
MSYAAKWIPTPAHGADKQLHLASAFSFLLFTGLQVGEARKELQRKVLSPLRAALKVPEVGMVKGAWSIDYTKVSFVCSAQYVKLMNSCRSRQGV